MPLNEDDCMAYYNFVHEINYEIRVMSHLIIVNDVKVDFVLSDLKLDDTDFYGAHTVFVSVLPAVQESREVGETDFMVVIASIVVDFMSVLVGVVAITRNGHYVSENLLQIVINGIAIVNY